MVPVAYSIGPVEEPHSGYYGGLFYKDTRIGETVKFQLRFEFFNLWNQHIFTASGQFGESAFTTDISSPNFGMWNGNVTNPRNVQIGARLEF